MWSVYVIFRIIVDRIFSNKISTFCDSPIGAGLGASSTITVSLIYGLSKFFDLPMTRQEVAEAAFYVERVRCQMSGGKQDQFSASYGSMNLLEFGKRWIRRN